MNERIQELITAYLHRGSTPEQERELFEACRNDPSAAEHLRQHLILSLKLRGLRDGVEVDDELHHAVARRIEALPVTAAAPEIRAHAEAAAPARRFGFRHVFGAAAVTAAAAVLLTLFLKPAGNPAAPPSTATVANVSDTVYIVARDTIRQVREVTRPVYIVRGDLPPRDEERTNPAQDAVEAASHTTDAAAAVPDAPLIAEDRSPGTAPESASGSGAPAQTGQRTDAAMADGHDLYADARPAEPRTSAAQKRNYLEQYNAMLVSVTTVKLTEKDRISY